MDKFMKALDFDSDTLGNVKRDMNFVLQRLIGNMMEKGSKGLRQLSCRYNDLQRRKALNRDND